MPYSRVGVMPETVISKDAKGSNQSRSSRFKGITMEDLKKQTALRLAQEQNDFPLQQDDFVGGSGRQQQLGLVHPCNVNKKYAFSSSDRTVPYPRPIQHHQDCQHHHQYTPDGMSNVHLTNDNDQRHLQILPLREQQELQQHRNQQQPAGYIGVSSYYHTNCMPPQDQNVVPLGTADRHLIKESHHIGNCTHSIGQQTLPRTAQPLQPTSTLFLPPNTMHLQHQQPFTSLPNGPHISTTITRNNSNTLKNKLPHGLTVHELKEMTKARLQSEAVEKSNELGEIQAVTRDRVSPLDFDSGESLRDRAMSRDSSSTGRINSNHVTSYFQNHQVSPKMIQTQLQPQSQMLQSVYHPSNILAASSSFRTTTARNDTWETTSNASHNSTIYSDNLGSESTSEVGSFGHSSHRNRSFTYPAVQVVQSLDMANTSSTSYGYKESRSFSNPSPVQASPHRGAGVIGSQSLFNAAVGGNRRRAVTLSPNTGSILEDKPLRYDSVESGDRLEIPNFSSGISDTTSLSAAPPTQNLHRGYSPVLEQLGLGLDNTYLSNGTESGSVFRGVTIKNGSSLPGFSHIGSREEKGLNIFPSNTRSNVFRSASTTETRAAAPPPGFTAATTSPGCQTAFSRVGSMDSYCNINQKSSWDRIKNVQINQSNQTPEETLVSDFGSVLHLSGSDRRDRERANTYTFGSSQSYRNNSHFTESF